MSEMKEKVVRFFQAGYLVKGQMSYPRTVDWETVLAGLRNTPKRTIKEEDRWFSPSPQTLSFGMHKILNTDFITRINASNGTVGDLLRGEDDEEQLAISTAVLAFGQSPYLALCYGDLHSPRASLIEGLLEAELSLADGASWKIKPMMDRSMMTKLKKARGVEGFSSSFTTQRDLMRDADENVGGPADLLEQLANNVDSELNVDLKFDLSDYGSQRPGPAAKLKNLIIGNLRALAGPKSKAQALIVDEDGKREMISLVEDKLTAQIKLDLADGQPRFSELMSAMENSRTDLRREIDLATGG